MSHKKSYILAILMAIVSFTSCTDNDFMGAPLAEEGTEVYVSVTLNVGGNAEGTRAGSPQMDYGNAGVEYGSVGVEYGSVGTRAGVSAPGDGNPTLDMKEGLVYEKYIKPYNVDLYIFDNDLKFVAKSISIIPTSNRCIGIFDKIDANHITQSQTTPYHIVAVCNHLQEVTLTAGTSTLDDLIAELTYSYNKDFTANLVAEKYTSATIPMWGILPFRFEEPTATDNMTTLTDPINVLRAMAKVRIRLTASDYTLKSVTLNVANTKGFVAAQKNGTTPQAYVKNTANTGYTTNWNYVEDTNNKYVSNEDFNGDGAYDDHLNGILYPSIPSETGTESNLSFSKGVTDTDADGKSHSDYHVIYIPEYKNIAVGSETVTPASMTLNISKGTETGKDYTLHFADYSATTAPSAPEWDIIRNDIYDYTITGITEPGKLEARVQVQPWDKKTMTYELSQKAGIKLTSDPAAKYLSANYVNETVYSADITKTDNFATFTFKVPQPAGVEWVAHLSDHYNFDWFGDTKGYGGEKDAEGNDKVYTIHVAPRYPYQSGNVLDVELSFSIGTLLKTANIIIPTGKDEDYGIANNKIKIRQVSAQTETAEADEEAGTE